ncbi:MAG: glycosyltransferase family 2 protein [Thermoguttaceae bacterium]|nr:glycosyltransferase family 2 protein [Thermoguttaceae bacterium]MDW8078838.1 glycosyltransferase family 2 protein [Thermoguttaceae bacterium]
MNLANVGLSVVIPVYNEEQNIAPLTERLVLVLASMTDDWEVIFVNDGSADGTQAVLESYAQLEPRIKVIQFRRNYGQTAALAAGIQSASKDLVATLDGDLQNDPADLPRMVAELLSGGYDIVHGWRRNRQDPTLLRKLPSRIANRLITHVTRVPVHDLGCALRVMRREIAQELELYGQMHRFIPILAHWKGARSTEIVTHHHPRRFGRSKYGLERTLGVLLDLLTVKFIVDYLSSPMRFFGRIALVCFAVGILAAFATVGMKLLDGVDMTGNPLLLLAALSAMVGVQFISLGVLGELCIRIYYAAGARSSFAIRKFINFEEQLCPAAPRAVYLATEPVLSRQSPAAAFAPGKQAEDAPAGLSCREDYAASAAAHVRPESVSRAA